MITLDRRSGHREEHLLVDVIELLGQLKLQLPLFDFETHPWVELDAVEETGFLAASYSILKL